MAAGPPAARALESIPFQGELLVHSCETGALALLNGTAGEALALLQAGHSDGEAARLLASRYGVAGERVGVDLAGFRASLLEAGLLGGTGHSPCEALPTPPAAASEAREPAFDAVVTCGGTAVRLSCEEPALAALLAAVLRPALSSEPATGTIELAGSEGHYACHVDGRLVWSCAPRPLARRNLLRQAIVATLPEPPAALLHASAAIVNGQAVVLAGDSGSGKTTLAAGLVGEGGLLLADDLLPLLADGGLAPVPFALSLKAGSWKTLRGLFPEVSELPTLVSRGLKVRYLWPGAERVAGTPQAPAVIVFPLRQSGAEPRWELLPPRQTLERLIDSGTTLEPLEGALGALARLAAETPAYVLTYDRLADGTAAVCAILARSLERRLCP